MAIALDLASFFNSGTSTTFSSLTGSHTCTGADYLLVTTSARNGGADNITGVTYNLAAMTDLGTATMGSTQARMFGLIAPTAGANNVVVTLATGTSEALIVGVRSWSGVDQTTPVRGGAATAATGTSTTPTVTVTSAVGEVVCDVIAFAAAQTYVSTGAGQTLDYSDADAGVNFRRGAGSHEAGAASVVMDHTISASGVWASLGCSLMPAAGGGGGSTQPPRSMHQFRTKRAA